MDRVRDTERAGGVNGEPVRIPQDGFGGRQAVAVESRQPGAGSGLHFSVGSDAADAIRPVVGHVQGTVRSDGDSLGPLHHGLGSRASLSVGMAGRAVVADAGDGGDDPVGRDAPDAVVVLVGDVQVSGAVDAHPGRAAQARFRRRSAIAREAAGAGSANGGDQAVRR